MNTRAFQSPELLRAAAPIGRGDVLGILAVRNERLRLPVVLDHHRRLGVDRFIVVDNASDDGTEDLLAAMRDVQLYRATGQYGACSLGWDWLHPLLDELADNHWILTFDADELFVYPRCEQIGLQEFSGFLDRAGSDSVFAIMLDMYSEKSVTATSYRPGESLLEACPYFDSGPYDVIRDAAFPTFRLLGGPRRRVFWSPDTPLHPPSVSKIPFLRWRRGYRYDSAAHTMHPAPEQLAGVTGALLHFKFLSDFHDKAKREATRGEHWGGAAEYKLYLQRLQVKPELSLFFAGSVRYRGSDQLVSLGLCRTLDGFERLAGSAARVMS